MTSITIPSHEQVTIHNVELDLDTDDEPISLISNKRKENLIQRQTNSTQVQIDRAVEQVSFIPQGKTKDDEPKDQIKETTQTQVFDAHVEIMDVDE